MLGAAHFACTRAVKHKGPLANGRPPLSRIARRGLQALDVVGRLLGERRGLDDAISSTFGTFSRFAREAALSSRTSGSTHRSPRRRTGPGSAPRAC